MGCFGEQSLAFQLYDELHLICLAIALIREPGTGIREPGILLGCLLPMAAVSAN